MRDSACVTRPERAASDLLQCATRWYATCLCIRMRLLSSKDKPCRELHKSRRHAVDHLSERGIAYVAIHRRGTEELPMIECIEGFHSELQRFRLREPQI